MKLHVDSTGTMVRITGYGDGYVVVNDQRLEESVLLRADGTREPWASRRPEQIGVEDMRRIASLAPELVLLGTGARQRFPSPEVLSPLMERRIGVEVMDTRAACRTFNILAGEGRDVLAALLIAPE